MDAMKVSDEVGRETVRRCAAAVAAVIEEFSPAMPADDPDARALVRLAGRLRRLAHAQHPRLLR